MGAELQLGQHGEKITGSASKSSGRLTGRASVVETDSFFAYAADAMSGVVSIDLQPKVIQVRDLTDGTYVLRIERHSLPFRAGQCITLGTKRMRVNREYSIYSGEGDPYFDLLIREVPDGTVSPALRRCSPGEILECTGPYGSFVLSKPEDRSRTYLFIATGTGIAPFHAYRRSHPGINYRLLHGIRYLRERYDLADYDRARYVACVSREEGGDFHGRVTDYLKQHPVTGDIYCYLCGNGRMLSEAYDLLRSQGISSDRLFLEAFF
jgi:ferredoxin/flavodoxin---NADP+ reductase